MSMVFHQSTLCKVPCFFYPTTILLVDDDPMSLDTVSLDLRGHYKTVSFSNPNEAIDFLTDKSSAFRGRLLSNQLNHSVLEFRKELYNAKRFEDVLIAVIDYDMPDKSGFDVWQHVGLNDYQHSHQHSYILLTAKRYADFEEELAKSSIGKNFISKFDPNYLDYLLNSINKLSIDVFQSVCHGIERKLTHDSQEQTSFLNEGNFLPIFNAYLKEQDICEGYLFDKQGSLILLDKHANLSWLFVRSEKGVKNSIELAKQYGAPTSVIQSLASKEMILSLYEKEDFESRAHIDWDSYLLTAEVLTYEEKEDEVLRHVPSDYYYAFTANFPEHGIDQTRILSYQAFLEQE